MPELRASDIIDLLQSVDSDLPPRGPNKPPRLWTINRWLTRRASTTELIAALQEANQPMVRQEICHILWIRCEVEAVPTIIACLEDPMPSVRKTAADALYHIGDRRAGPVLLEHFNRAAKGSGEQVMLAFALGSVEYRPAVPALTTALGAQDYLLRMAAASSLGMLGAVEAKDALLQAAQQESHQLAREDIESALETIEFIDTVQNAPDYLSAVSLLVPALRSPAPQLRGAAVRLLGQLGGKDTETLLETTLVDEKTCGIAQRIQEALIAIKTRSSDDPSL